VNIAFSSDFLSQSKALTSSQKSDLYAALELFEQDPLHAYLSNHPLRAKYKTYRSIDIAPDLRALYIQKNGAVVFVAVGTHKQLYG